MKRLAPGPAGHALFGKLFDVRRDRLRLVTTIRRDFGDIVRFRMASRILHLVSRPEYIRHVLLDNQANYHKGVGLSQARRWLGDGLVTSEGDVWARQRRLVQPSFQRTQFAPFGAAVTECTADMIEKWRALASHGEPIELSSQLMRLTLRVIARVMFSTDIDDGGELGAAFTRALHDTMDRMTQIVAMPDWMPFPGKRRFLRALRTLDGAVNAMIEQHRRPGSGYSDLLSRLLAEHDGSGDRLDDREVRDQVLTILLAGHETTASSIAWTFHLLERHPEARLRMLEESRSVLGGRLPTHDDVPRLVWTRMIYEEALRLYPPVWLIPRRAVADDEIGGYHIPAGSEVLVCPYVIHRHPDYWQQPDRFDPGRFSPDQSSVRPQYCYLPFGSGPRACVGKSLATMEALLILTMISQSYEFQSVPGHDVVPDPLLTLRFRQGMMVYPVLTEALVTR